jgi:hypothetical protein
MGLLIIYCDSRKFLQASTVLTLEKAHTIQSKTDESSANNLVPPIKVF